MRTDKKIKLIKLQKEDAVFIQENFSYAFRDSSIDGITRWIENGQDELLFGIAYDQEKIGFIILGKKEESVLSWGIAIKTEYQGKGIAAICFQQAQKEAKKRGYKKVISSCSTDNIASFRLHEKCGFKLIKTEINQAGYEMHRWEKEI